MNLTSLDSNVVLRLILNDVAAQSAKAAEYVNSTSCYVADTVVAECVFVLEKVYKLDRKLIRKFMTILFGLNTVSFNETLINKTFVLYISSKPLSFVDCYSVVEARLNANTLITFDQAILKKHAPGVLEPK